MKLTRFALAILALASATLFAVMPAMALQAKPAQKLRQPHPARPSRRPQILPILRLQKRKVWSGQPQYQGLPRLRRQGVWHDQERQVHDQSRCEGCWRAGGKTLSVNRLMATDERPLGL